jgi:Na+-transporting NADH:ubiquinone oxidoreductase subunit NqrD
MAGAMVEMDRYAHPVVLVGLAAVPVVILAQAETQAIQAQQVLALVAAVAVDAPYPHQVMMVAVVAE